MKNVADSSFQSLPVVDREHAVLTLVRTLAAVDLILCLLLFVVPASGALGTLLFGVTAILPIATSAIVYSQLRGPLLAAYVILAACVTFATVLGPLAAVLGAGVFWVSYLVGLSALD